MTECFVFLRMPNTTHSYNAAIIARLQLIMDYTGLEISGFSEFTGVSESHLYALLNGTKKLTGTIADKIGSKIGIPGWKILQLDYEISNTIRKHPELVKFYKTHKDVKDYFTDSRDKRKQSYYLEYVLLNTNFFEKERYVWEVLDECEKVGRKYKSKDVSQTLNHLTKKGKMNKAKRQFRSRDGSFKNRMVYVFLKANSDNQ